MTLAAIRWKLRQKYSQLRSLVSGGRFIWQVEPNIRFVARSDDTFSHVLFVCKGHEMTELRWCRRWLRPGDSVIDCGANVGYFSAYLAQSISLEQILAIEGNPRTAAICADNFDVLEIKNVRVVRIILAASEGERLVIPDVPGREPWQRTVNAGKADPSVPVSTLDRLIETYRIRASLVKIDCEGYEPFILAGSRELLRSQSAAFMVECNDAALLAAQTSRTELFGLFRQHDYALFHLASFGSYYPFGIRCDESFPSAEFNFAAIPNNPSDLQKWQAIASDFQSPSGMDNNRSGR